MTKHQPTEQQICLWKVSIAAVFCRSRLAFKFVQLQELFSLGCSTFPVSGLLPEPTVSIAFHLVLAPFICYTSQYSQSSFAATLAECAMLCWASWFMLEMIYLHKKWRASSFRFREFPLTEWFYTWAALYSAFHVSGCFRAILDDEDRRSSFWQYCWIQHRGSPDYFLWTLLEDPSWHYWVPSGTLDFGALPCNLHFLRLDGKEFTRNKVVGSCVPWSSDLVAMDGL